MDNTNNQFTNEMDSTNNQFTKENIQLFDIVETRNGNRYIVLYKDGLVLLNIETSKYLSLEGYDDNLYYDFNDDFDILKVRTPTLWNDAFRVTGMCLDCRERPIDWSFERENEEYEITLRDLNKLLGYRVKIIE